MKIHKHLTICLLIISALIIGVNTIYLSKQVDAVTLPTPLAPTITQAAVGSCGLNVTWKAVTGATSYNLYRKFTNSDDSTYSLVKTTSNVTTLDPVPNDDYTYKLLALSSAG